MNKTDKAKEYATALFTLAMEQGAAKKFAAALETVVKSMRESPDYIEFLCAPNIPLSERNASLQAVFGG